MEHEKYIRQTRDWVAEVVIGLNFCPFANKEFKSGRIRFEVVEAESMKNIELKLLQELKWLEEHSEVETTLLIFPTQLKSFDDFLKLKRKGDRLITKHDFFGVFQLADFHPEYLFDRSDVNDPANYTNRSPYPMLHILREESIEKAVFQHNDIHSIPHRNIQFAHEKGLDYFVNLMRGIMNR